MQAQHLAIDTNVECVLVRVAFERQRKRAVREEGTRQACSTTASLWQVMEIRDRSGRERRADRMVPCALRRAHTAASLMARSCARLPPCARPPLPTARCTEVTEHDSG